MSAPEARTTSPSLPHGPCPGRHFLRAAGARRAAIALRRGPAGSGGAMVRGGRGDGARGRPGGAGKGGWGGPVPCPRRGGNGGGAAAAAASGMEGSRARPLGVAGRGAGAVRGLQGALPCPAGRRHPVAL